MNSLILSFFLFLLSVKCYLFAGETTYTYLIFVSSYPTGDKVDIPIGSKRPLHENLSEKGYASHPIPLKKTRTLTYPNTNYMILKVTPSSDSEDNFIKGQVTSGRIKLLWVSEYVDSFNPVRGGYEKKVLQTRYEELPSDINKDWSVEVSTP